MKNNCFERAEILCVGTELLIGDIVNTNAAYLSRRLAALGIGVYRQGVVGDNPARLQADVRAALSRSDLVIMSGGLGPTYDDLTKETVAALFGRKMQMHAPSLSRIESYFAATGRVMTENNKKQAMMPEGAVVFPNDYGTAPALALENEGGQVVVMLPGPPRELEPLFCEQVEPYLKKRCEAILVSRNLHIVGMGESAVEAALPRDIRDSQNPTVAPYCQTGEVRLRVTARDIDEAHASALCDLMVERLMALPIAEFVYGIDVPAPEYALVAELQRQGKTIATAESCTGGLIVKKLTDVAGCSDAVAGGAVTYQTHEKTRLLGVDAALIAQNGVVSAPVAEAMARGALAAFAVDVAIATTGYAGPGGGTENEPVGTVFVAVADRDGVSSRRLALGAFRDRAYIREVSSVRAICDALAFLRKNAKNS
ncbi:MAG: competence/damage-inducible protein A [Ruminococcaceae bacterium]|nr:competence/damage-inducible protein A [Oscillospiraceae bacterium]